MRLLSFSLLALGMAGIVISLPLLGIAALAFLGILADIGPNENRAIGIQVSYLGLPLLIGGIALRGLGLVVGAKNRRLADAEQDAASDQKGP